MSKELKEINEIAATGVGKKTFFFTFFFFFLLVLASLLAAGYFAFIKYQQMQAKVETISAQKPEPIDISQINNQLSESADAMIADKEQKLQTLVDKLNQEFAFISDSKLQLQEENCRFWLDYTLTYWNTSLNPTHTILLLQILRDKFEKLNLQKYSSLLATIDKDIEKLKAFPTSLDINTSFDNLFIAIKNTSTKTSDTTKTENNQNPYLIRELAYWQYYITSFWNWVKSGISVNEDPAITENFDEFALELNLYITQIKLSLATNDFQTAQELALQLREKVLARYKNIDKNIFLSISNIFTKYKDTTLSTKGI